MQIELHIDALTLNGFPPQDYDRFGAALECELGLLFAERGIPSGLESSWQADDIRLGQIDLPGAAEPEMAAVYVARKLYDGLTGESLERSAKSRIEGPNS